MTPKTFSVSVSSETLEIRQVLLYVMGSPSSDFRWSQNASRGSPYDGTASCTI